MYTSYIGKKFLSAYNRKSGKDFSAKEFFDQILFPLFFDHDRHAMHVHGSTFFQSIDKKDLASNKSEALIRLERLHKDVSNKKFSGSTYVGYAAEKIDRVTSGQVSNLDTKIDAEEVYASWIGEGLSIGVTGGMNLIDNEEVLWNLFLGWEHYRLFLNRTPNLKGRQIETWNGHWLCHSLSEVFNSELPLNGFEFLTSESTEEKGLAIPTVRWTKVLFVLCKRFPDKTLTSYTYSLSKTNTTLGFINFYLSDVHKMYELRDKVFLDKKQSILSDEAIEQLQAYYSFKDACRLGTIGLKAIEPDKLREFMPVPFGRGKDCRLSDEASYTQFQIFKIWIMAMLNKKELLSLANKIASALSSYEQKNKEGGRGRTTHAQLTDEIRNSPSLVKFLDRLNTLLNSYKTEEMPVNRQDIADVLDLPSDRFPLFLALVKIEYTFLSKQIA